jgi:TonB-linked SusC/RagA family outer membrane protein
MNTFNQKLMSALAVIVLLVTSSMAYAQDKMQVTGHVRDTSTGQPILGALVVIKGTTQGTTTDQEGHFTLEASTGSTLAFSYMGYSSQEIVFNGQNPIDVSLSEDVIGIDQVVVIGYGSTTRKEVTGSVSSLRSEDFNKGTFTTAAGLLQGKVAGLQVVNASGGDPDGQFELLLRGANTLKSSQSPLVIIDGVMGADIRNINFQEVESIDVLKDGSAAAIYGARGTNGVIIITTKRAKAGATQVEYSGQLSVQTIARRAEPMTADEYSYTIKNFAQGAVGSIGSADTDWFDEIVRVPVSHKHTLSISGGTEKFSHRTTLNAELNQGLQKRNNSNKYLIRTNMRQKILQGWVDLDYNLSISKRKYSPSNTSAFSQAFSHNPTEPVYDPLNTASGGYYTVTEMDYYNPVAMINENTVERQADDISANVRASLNILPIDGLKWDNFISYEQERFEERGYRTNYYPSMIGAGGRAEISNEYWNRLQWESTINYNHTFNHYHKVQAILGYTYVTNMDQSSFMNNQGYDFDFWETNDIGSGELLKQGQATMSSFKGEDKYIAFFGRLMYNYKEKYLLSASLRRDGSSRFGANNKWAWFPAVSAGWRISGEEFLRDVKWLDELKLRAGYGVTGNQDIDRYMSLSLMGFKGKYYYSGGEWIPTYDYAQNPNPDLKWEEKSEFNVGMDFSLFKGRLTGAVDYYRRNTHDLLYTYQVPSPPYASDELLANVGDITNTGIEVTLSGLPVVGKNFRWSTTLTFAHGKNKLNKFTNEMFQNTTTKVGWLETPMGVYPQRLEEGESLGTFYAPVWIGVVNGKDKFEGAIGSTVPAETKWQNVGTAYPDFTLGWSNTLTYKNWDLNMSMRASIGGKVFNSYRAYYENVNTIGLRNALGSWLDDTSFTGAATYSSKYIEDATYLKLDNVALGYNFVFDSKFVQSLRIYAAAQNVLCITGYKGVDPEVSLLGIAPGIESRSYYPRTSVFTMGVNITF